MKFPQNYPQSKNFVDMTPPFLGDDSILSTSKLLEKYGIDNKDLDFMQQRGWGLHDMILLKQHFENIMKQPLRY